MPFNDIIKHHTHEVEITAVTTRGMDRKQVDEDAESDKDGVSDEDVDLATGTLDPILDKDRIKEMQQDLKLKHIYGYLAEGNLPSDGVVDLVCWSLKSLCHSNGHIETMPG